MNIKIFLERYKATKPSRDRYKIIQIDNAISVVANKHAKEENGEGPQGEYYVGDYISNKQAKQICSEHNVSVLSSQSDDMQEFFNVNANKDVSSITETLNDDLKNTISTSIELEESLAQVEQPEATPLGISITKKSIIESLLD